MNTVEFLSYLRNLNIELSANGEKLRLSAPKGALTPFLREQIAARKAELFAFLRQTAAAGTQFAQTPIAPAPRDKPLPLSFAQQRLWFLDQLEPNSPLYNIPSAVRLRGALDVEALQQALETIVARHETLRTTFIASQGNPTQVISAPAGLPLPVMDLGTLPRTEREAGAKRLAGEEASRPFDLGRGPLLRATLLRLAEEDHLLLLTMHHIISDGWSMGVLFRELSMLYTAFAMDKPSPLPELPIQYADFAVWQREWLQGEVLEAQLAYWKEQLAGAPPALELPIDRPRPAIQAYRGAQQPLALSKTLSEGLKALSQQERVTLFMILLAAFQTWLYQHTGQTDIVVGSPIANRNRAEAEGLIGFFVNTLALRGDLSGDPTFQILLARVREVCLGAYAHQDLPFEKLVEELRPERHLSRLPLLQVMLSLQNAPREELALPGLTARRVDVYREAAKFDLSLNVFDLDEGLSGAFWYNTDLFDAATIERMAEHFQTLLGAILADPGQPLSRLACLTEEEQRQLVLKRIKASSSPARGQLDDLQSLTNLTPFQFQFWVGQKLEPETGFFNLIDTFTIRGLIHHEHFQKAFQALIEHTDALRTIIEEVAGVPRQRVVDELPYALEYVDLSSEADPEASFHAWMDCRLKTPFDLEKCLFDAALVKVAEDHFIWYLSIHHIISDGWSFSLIFQRMQALYRSSLEGHLDGPVQFPSFQDLVDEQRAYRNSSQYLVDQAYWEKKLAYEIERITFYGRAPARRAAHVRRVGHALGAERTARLKALASQDRFAAKTLNVALFNILAGVFAAYLYRITANASLSIGTPFLNRPSTAFRETVGLFMQVAPLHIKVSEGDTFASLIQKVQAESYETAQHCRLTLRNHQNSLYDVTFNYHNVSFSSFHGAPAQENWIHSGNDGNSLSLHVRYPEAASLLLHFDFHPDVFEEDQQERAIQHFMQVMDVFLENPDRPIGSVDLISPEERQLLLVELNQTQAALSDGLCAHQLVQAQVERTPNAVAVVGPWADASLDECQPLTYAELNSRANQLAHFLHKQGIGPEVLVGICVERSLDMLVGMLGILKAGGAYVPIDPAYPKQRLAFMLEDAQVSVLLTQSRLINNLPDHTAPVICLDTDWGVIAGESDENLDSRATADHLAYVIYTSGSTGQPKGVMVQHRSLVSLIETTGTKYKLSSGDCVLQFASISWDTSAEEIYPCLARGASLVLRTPSMLDSIPTFLEMCEDWGLTVLNLPTAYWHELATSLGSQGLKLPASIRLMIIGGERALPEMLAIWEEYGDGRAQLVNTYGMTEATAVTTMWELPVAAKVGPIVREVPIGHPIANTQTYILDRFSQPVPIGVSGELHIGGVGLARGYLNRPDLTADKFIPDFFGDQPGARLYRTGDLARFLPDGNIECLGRIDQQVKMRGFRIELGEIEAVLGQHPAVRESVVVARDVQSAPGKHLVAYVVCDAGKEPTSSELRSHLKAKLPEYMLPSVFLVLPALPLSPNGKVDRRALPDLDQSPPVLDTEHDAPRTPTEEMLVGIWAGVLGLKQVGIHDNFFEVGGHSLLATQLVSRVRDRFQIELPLRELFVTPTIAGLAETIDRAVRATSGLLAPPIRPISQDGPLPLSFAQQRLWFLDYLEPSTPLYNMSTAMHLSGRLDAAALEKSLNEVVRRHEALRTTFWAVDGQPVQRIAPVITLGLPTLDLGALPPMERKAESQRLAAEESQRPFDLSRGPLLRATLLRLDEDEHVLLLSMHHIISDGWSMGVLFRELSALYAAYAAGKPSPLPELPIQYADFAVWQRKWLQGEVLATQLGYWKQRLEGIPPALELPTDRPVPPVPTHRGARQPLVLPEALLEDLRALSQREGVTLFMTLLAAFQTLLHRYTRQDDVVVGSPIANRNRVELEGLIGFFANTLVLRGDLSGAPSFRELLARLREVCLGTYAHQDLPFEKLVEELRPVRDTSRSPLFQVLFALQNIPREEMVLPGVAVSRVAIDWQSAKFDLSLFLFERGDGLSGAFEYSTDLFDAATMKRMAGHFQTLLEAIVSNPGQRLSALPLLAETERRQLILEWKGARIDYPRDACIHELFETQVKRAPERVAVTFEDQTLTYQELNGRANQLAHHLRTLGVGPEVMVGICTERSWEMVVGILAILKAGGAYVPMDPAHPKERLAFVLEDTQAPVLLTQRRLVERLPECGAQVVCLDADTWRAGLPEENLASEASGARPDNLAYVIYTSGSTGRPKGVLITHYNVVRLFSATQSWFHFKESDVWTLFHSCAFDFSVWEIWGALLYGGRLVVVPYWVSRSPRAFYNLLGEQKVTVLNQTPSAFHQLMQAEEELEAAPDLCLRLVIFGGEALELHSLKPWFDRHGDQVPRLVNMYGITETTVHVTYRPLIAADANETQGSLVGRPIPDLSLQILDRHLQPVPIGVPGELCIGGAGLGRGYLHRPELTAERFVVNPFSAQPGARLYRSGDLARYLQNGDIEYLGRIDQQVKVRGFRVELGEIEATLGRHPAVCESLVVPSEDGLGGKRLVAYVVPKHGAIFTTGELRNYLKYKLPDYMVPSAFMTLGSLPLTPNGKVDRQALPVPDTSLPRQNGNFIAPRTMLELELVHIWEDILNVHPIGIADDFFDLGGHSLLAVRLIAQIHKRLGQELSVAALFQRGATIEHLASLLRWPADSKFRSSLVPIEPRGSRRPFFCVHPVGGNVLCYVDLARRLGPDQPFYGLQHPGLYEDRRPFTRIQDMAAHYIDAIQTVQPEGPYVLGGWSMGALAAFEMAAQLRAQGESVAVLALLDPPEPIAPDRADYQADGPTVLARFARDFGLALEDNALSWELFRQLGPDEQLSYLLAQARAANLVTSDIDLEQLARHLQVFLANDRARRRYTPHIYEGRITLIKAAERTVSSDLALGWSRWAAGGVDVYTIPGNHYTLLKDPHVRTLAERLKDCLEQAWVEDPPAKLGREKEQG